MNSKAEIRVTLYALISALETDLRSFVREYVLPHYHDSSYIKDNDLLEKCKNTFIKENESLDAEKNYDSLLDYIYFQDSYKILNMNKEYVPDIIIRIMKKYEQRLNNVIAVRNRVMHQRPLLSGDFSSVYLLILDLIRNSRLKWNSCQIVVDNLENNPNYIFSLNMPETEVIDINTYHNLPLPDFDESGFIGRESDSEYITKLILGNTRVLSVIGDGGVGKSALVLKVAYDILDLKEKCPFDAIIWTTAKATMLSSSGISELKNEINNYFSFINILSHEFGAPSTDLQENIKEILEFMNNFRVLLVIDNLETILDENIRLFIREAQQRCKIIITSRVGLGELELPRKLEGFSEKESAQLIREIGKIRNSKFLTDLPNKQLVEFARQLHYNPLALKWFINSVDTGRSPQEILNNKNDLLKFCLSNVYDKLASNAKYILSTLLAARKALNDAELNFLTNLNPIEMKIAIIQLLTTTLVNRNYASKSDTSEYIYNISDFAKEFLMAQYPLDKSFIKSVSEKLKKLADGYEDVYRVTKADEFNIFALSIRNQNERVIARYLQEAMKLSKQDISGKYELSLTKIKEAKEIVPGYFEIYRVSGFIKAVKGDYLGAEEDYKTALELEPKNARLLFFYSGFLLQSMKEYDKALFYATRALNLNPESVELKVLYSRCIGYSGNYDEAIKIIESIPTSNISLRNRRVVATTKIDFYKRVAEDDIRIRKDIVSSLKNIDKVVCIFREFKKNSEIDNKLLTAFSKYYLDYLINSSKKVNYMDKVNAINIYKEFSDFLIQSDRHNIICDKLYYCFEFDVKNYNSEKLVPSIIK